MMAESVNSLLKMHPSSVVYERVQTGRDSFELVFGLREESKRLHLLGPEPEIEFRPGVIYEYAVELLPIFFRIGPLSPLSLFLTWINAHEPEGLEALRLLTVQPQIRLELYDRAPEPEKTFTIENPHRQFLAETLIDMEASPRWTPEQYETAKLCLYQRRPTIMDIWWLI
jgi:hypothetical protein